MVARDQGLIEKHAQAAGVELAVDWITPFLAHLWKHGYTRFQAREEAEALKQKLAQNRDTAPLFEIAAYTQNIESAYGQMHARAKEGLAPAHIVVRP